MTPDQDFAGTRFVAVALLFLSVLARSAAANPATAQRLDASLPASATCLIKLGTGPRMRVPRAIVNAPSCSDQRQATPVEQFDLTLEFPEMTVGLWTGAMGRIFAQEAGKDVVHVDEFPVRFIYIFYPEQFANPSLDDWSGPNPQVWQMKARRLDDSRRQFGKDNVPTIRESKIPGLRTMSYAPPSWPRTPGPTGKYDQAVGILIEPEGADYDLLMSCDATIECLAFVQIKSSRTQYRFLMPSEAAVHAGELIPAVNKMIGKWTSAGQ